MHVTVKYANELCVLYCGTFVLSGAKLLHLNHCKQCRSVYVKGAMTTYNELEQALMELNYHIRDCNWVCPQYGPFNPPFNIVPTVISQPSFHVIYQCVELLTVPNHGRY